MRIPANPWRPLLIVCLLLASGFTAPRGGIGGTGLARGGIGGTGVTAIGVIQRFGSIFVNGTEYLLLPTTRYQVDGHRAQSWALRRGNVVFVEARTRDHRSLAETVRVQHALVGIIRSVAHNGRALRILGQTVLMSRTTVRGRTAPNPHFRVGMEVRVSALPSAPGRWQATRIEALKKPRSRDMSFLIRGKLTAVRRHALVLGRHLFLSTARTTPPPGTSVLARGVYRLGHAVITRVRAATGLSQAHGRRVLIAGYLTPTRTGWRYEGTTLKGPVATAIMSRPGPSFFVAVRTARGTFVIRRIIPAIHVMSYGLARVPHGPSLYRARIDRPRMAMSRSPRLHIDRPAVSGPIFMRPRIDLSRPSPP